MTRYYHGGAPHIRMVLPSRETGAIALTDYGMDDCRRDKVYLTTSLDAAVLFASLHPSGHGTVYEVNPVGSVEPDPDFLGDGNDGILSLQCDKARVVKAVRVPSEIQAMMRHEVAGAQQGNRR